MQSVRTLTRNKKGPCLGIDMTSWPELSHTFAEKVGDSLGRYERTPRDSNKHKMSDSIHV